MVETLKAGAAEVYVVHSAVLDLAGPVGVGKRLLAEGYHIRESGLDDSLRLNGIIELALNEERHCDAFLAQALCDVELCPLLLVCAWNGKIPAFIAAIVDMHIGKVHILQTAGNLYALVLKGASTLNLVDRRIFYRNGEVGANCTANGLCALIKEAHTVIKRPAVLIVTTIPYLAHELVYQVAAVGVYLDNVNAGHLCQSCALAHAGNELMYLVYSERVTHDVGIVEGAVVACGDVNGLSGISLVHATIARSELNSKLGAVLVYLINEMCKARCLRIIKEEVAAALWLLVFVGYGVGGGIDEPEAALGTLKYVCMLLLRYAAVSSMNVSHRSHRYTVFQCNGTYFVFFKKM